MISLKSILYYWQHKYLCQNYDGVLQNISFLPYIFENTTYEIRYESLKSGKQDYLLKTINVSVIHNLSYRLTFLFI